MNLTAASSPSLADLVRSVLAERTLVAGEPFYAAGNGVVVIVAPLPAEEAATCGLDHEFTISTGFPPDPATAGITVWLQRRGQSGGLLDRIGETDRFGSLLFAAGSSGCAYQLAVTRGAGVRLASDGIEILPFPITAQSEPGAIPACPVCGVTSCVGVNMTTKLRALRDGLAAGAPVCRSHLCDSENVILGAARDGWNCHEPQVFEMCARLLADLLDEHGNIRNGFLQLFPTESQNEALNQIAGELSTAIAVGHVLSKNSRRATAAGHAAVVHLHSTARADRSEPVSDQPTPPVAKSLDALLSGIASRLGGKWAKGFQMFSRLSVAITQ